MTKTQVEVITSVQRRRSWSRAEKERIVAAALRNLARSLPRSLGRLESIAANYFAGASSFVSGPKYRRRLIRSQSRQSLKRRLRHLPPRKPA